MAFIWGLFFGILTLGAIVGGLTNDWNMFAGAFLAFVATTIAIAIVEKNLKFWRWK